MNIIETKISDIIPYENNAKKHDQKQINNVAESIKKYGFVQPIVVDSDNIIVIGHCRYEAAKKLKMQTVPCVCVDDLTEEQVKALRIVDNKSNESPWDMDLLWEELAEIDLSGFDFDWGLKSEKDENPYTAEVNVPQYQIHGDMPALYELYDNDKEKELIKDIENSNVREEEKEFLISAAHRHCRYNFTAIAEYYAHAEKEMQELMEKSALVIIDYNDAIANGYVKMSKKLEELINE